MDWKLVAIYLYYKYRKHLVITGCCIIILTLIFLYSYIGNEYKTYDNNVLVTSDKVINNYDLGNDYYIYYDDIKTNLHGKDIYINMSFSICGNIDNSFEVIVPSKYRALLGKRINLEINNFNYSFLVVGVCNSEVNNNFIYTSSETMDIIYRNSFELENYTYRFIVDEYKSLNNSLDILTSYDYDVSIKLNKSFVDMSNYDSIRDLIIVFIFFFVCVIWIFSI